MALTKEDLDKIKLPLSDEDYNMLRIEDARSGYKIWSLASPELREAFDKKEAERKQKYVFGGDVDDGDLDGTVGVVPEYELEDAKKCGLFKWLPWNKHRNKKDNFMCDVDDDWDDGENEDEYFTI